MTMHPPAAAPRCLASRRLHLSPFTCSEAVARCKSEIQSILSDEETKEEMECPAGIVGRIIGRGGETIRALQSASQVGACGWGRAAPRGMAGIAAELPAGWLAARAQALLYRGDRTAAGPRQPLALLLAVHFG